MTLPKIFVGTMYSGENELPRSVSRLFSQEGIEISHYVVHGKRELDAHRDLYATWNSVKDSYDAFMQLDPDTVLHENTSIRAMFDLLVEQSTSGYTSIQCPLMDFFTQKEIYGLNMYLPDVIFNVPNDEVFCDRATSNNRTIPFKVLPGNLNPIGDHCPDPTFSQAFHFGLHRGLKNRMQQRIDTINAFINMGDDRRAMAVLGFEMSRDFVANKKVSYSDDEFMRAYVKACVMLESFKTRLAGR